MATIGIYKITNLITSECYIGSSKDIERRFEQHKKDSSSKKLSESIYKYGLNSFTFEILEECNIEELKKKEKHYIYEYNSILQGFNSKNISDNNNSNIIRVMQLPIKDSDFNNKIESRKKELGLDHDASYLKFLISKDLNSK